MRMQWSCPFLNSLNSENQTLALCFDLSKAPGSVNHETFCDKLETCGVMEVALDLRLDESHQVAVSASRYIQLLILSPVKTNCSRHIQINN